MGIPISVEVTRDPDKGDMCGTSGSATRSPTAAVAGVAWLLEGSGRVVYHARALVAMIL